jgi:hypothetical protein
VIAVVDNLQSVHLSDNCIADNKLLAENILACFGIDYEQEKMANPSNFATNKPILNAEELKNLVSNHLNPLRSD